MRDRGKIERDGFLILTDRIYYLAPGTRIFTEKTLKYGESRSRL